MNPAEVIVHVVKRDVPEVILNLLAESVCQAGKAAHHHSHGQVLSLDIAGGNMAG